MGTREATIQRTIRWGCAAALVLFCGYNLNKAVHRFEGIVGMTTKNGFGCYCHSEDPTPAVNVWIEGPDTLQAGEQGVYAIFMSKDSTVTAGFNVATWFGTLDAVDTAETYWYEDELTHLIPKEAGASDTVSWVFGYTAPASASGLVDTLYSVANSTNRDTMATEDDHWNFGPNFLVNVVGTTGVDMPESGSVPAAFQLLQNYPNPFNGISNFEFRTASFSHVTLIIFDLLGREIATVVDEHLAPGTYTRRWDAKDLPTGVYMYRLVLGTGADSRSATGKLALIR